MRSGELFAGVGGLGMAVDEVFGSEPAWFAEFDAAPSKVLAHRYPGVPNFGDVTQLRDAPKVDILAGGFPCQDVSLAGARRGMKDGTRSGLWSEYARIIDEVRPDWVVIENVRGLISARADSEVEPCTWCVGDGDDEYHLRALDAVLADLARLGFDAEWTGLRAADIGAPHGRFRFFILAWPRERTLVDPARVPGGWSANPGTADRRPGLSEAATALTLLGTPRTADGVMHELRNPEAIGNPRGRLEDQVALLPTPMVGSSNPAAHGQISGDFRAAMDRAIAQWGQYAPAIERWERVVERPAPSPVRRDGKGENARLNPEFTEWMMGWPAGWVTDPAIGLSRAEQLKAAGNGVVPQQAAAALRMLLSRSGVPEIRKEVRS